MALKTVVNDASVAKFLDAIPDPERRTDAKVVAKMMQAATKSKPKMWGTSIVGFGTFHYKGASGREGDWMLIGLSPRKQALTLYLLGGACTSSVCRTCTCRRCARSSRLRRKRTRRVSSNFRGEVRLLDA